MKISKNSIISIAVAAVVIIIAIIVFVPKGIKGTYTNTMNDSDLKDTIVFDGKKYTETVVTTTTGWFDDKKKTTTKKYSGTFSVKDDEITLVGQTYANIPTAKLSQDKKAMTFSASLGSMQYVKKD